MFGFLNINKPRYVTSRDAVNQICKLLGSKRAGHAGTLDPLATGVLVIGVGPATRLISYIQEMPKVYLGDFKLGCESTTEDRFGEIREIENAPIVEREQLEDVLSKFTGNIKQVPPAHSALKIDGKRAYRLARKGKEVNLKPRTIEIHSLELVDFDYPRFRLKIGCGSGTYIRSLGRDIARSLGTCAIMTELERSSVGNFTVGDAIRLEEYGASNQLELIPALFAVSELPRVVVNQDEIRRFLDGQFLKFHDAAARTTLTKNAKSVVAVDQEQRLIAILERFDANNFKPKLNFAHYWQSV